MFNIRKKNIHKIDKILLLTIGLLLVFGLIVLASATKSLDKSFLPSQIISTVIGIILVGLLLAMDLDFIKKLYIPIYIISILLLVLVLLFGMGMEQWGANTRIAIGGVSFQPAEFVKIGLIISIARYIELNSEDINKPKVLLKILFISFLPVLLILKQPDAGTAMVFIFFIAAMLFSAGLSFKYILEALALGILSLPILYTRLDDFQKHRILNFLEPERDVSSTGWQAMQGRIAIGSGKFFGQGLFNGTQSQYNFIPEKQTDYIYAVLVEELGFLGGSLLIGLYGVMLYRIILIAKETKDLFGRLICIGFAAMFLFHIFENIGMTIGVMPITGIPLPFFSYGGTFQLTNLICIGLIFSVSIQKEPLSFE